MIQVTNLTKVFRGETDVTALTGINLNVDDGDIYGIIGMSGAGKSTLLRCIALLETPTQGRIEVDGVDISTLQGKDLTALRKSVGVIFQGYNLLMQRNVLRNVCFPLELDGVKKEAREARALELLNVVGLADKARAYPAQLSGGPSPGPWPTTPRSCCATSRPAPWTPSRPRASCRSCRTSTGRWA